jgi:spermidine synthase
VLAAERADRHGAESIGRTYALDSVGMIAGGLAFTFVMVRVWDHFRCLYVPAFLDLACATAISLLERRRFLLTASAFALLALADVTLTFDLDELSARARHAGFDVVFRGNSAYGSLVVTRSSGQHNFIENGKPLFSTGSAEAAEEKVHYAMAQRPGASRVLLVGGGVSGTVREVLKHGGARVDYVELDPLILRVADRFLPGVLDDLRVGVIEGDGRSYVRRTRERYEVIITDVPEPSTSRANRYYTREFYQEAKRAMVDGGVLCVPLGLYEDYVSKELARLVGTVRRTLGEAFANVRVITGGRLFLLASDGELTTDGLEIAARLDRAGVRRELLTRGYLESTLSRGHSVEQATQGGEVNTDFDPVLYHYHLVQWISMFRVSFGLLEGALLVGLAIYLVSLRPASVAIFSAGFAASALEVVILVGFQTVYGSVYDKLGMIVTAFMAGLAAGALAANRRLARWGARELGVLVLGVSVYAAALPFAMMSLGRVAGGGVGDLAGQAAFAGLTFILGGLVGMAFPVAGKMDLVASPGNAGGFPNVSATAGRIYAADLVGACLGALLVSTLLIPLLGVTPVCLLSAALCAAGGLLVLLKRSS